MTVEEDIEELKNRISDTYSIPIEFMKYFGLPSTLTLTIEEGYDRCIKCRKVFPSNELTDVHFATTLGVKLYKHTPKPMCKKCLNEAFEDIANKYGWNKNDCSQEIGFIV